MRRRSVITGAVCLSLLALALSAAGTAHADSRVERYVIAAGGGESSSGNFRVHGTIGQPTVAVLSGGGFTLRGGFWHAEVPPSTLYPLYLPLLLRQ
jgi:hypothetical protein